MSNDLTICSVIYDAKWEADLNWEITTKLNPGVELHWLLVINKPVQPQEPIKLEVEPQFECIEGVEREKEKTEQFVSRHHAGGLNKAMKHIKTRFLLVLDPDCYLLRQNWISIILDYIKKEKLAFFGVPYNPVYIRKPRYFPTPFCMFIDTEQVDIKNISWEPTLSKYRDYPLVDKVWREINHILGGSSKRNSVGREMDTGYEFTKAYRDRSSIRVECVQPVYRPQDYNADIKGSRPFLEYFFPDRFCLVPKKKDYFSTKGFSAFHWPDLKVLGAEEYLWQGQPFAVHMRSRKSRRGMEHSIDQDKLIDLVRQFPELIQNAKN